MKSPIFASRLHTAYPSLRLAWIMGCAALALVLSSCASSDTLPHDAAQNEPGQLPVRYSIICFVRGDGDYLYHDSLGAERAADEEALAGAVRVARNNPHAEVFILHEKPRDKFLFVVPLPDVEFSYYRNGQLRASTAYLREDGSARFDRAVNLYEEYREKDAANVVRIFLYFGHEIAEVSDADDEEDPSGRPLTVQDLAGGLGRMTAATAKFDLVVLSSCFNGTPYTIASMSPYAKLIVASPDNLHLSYFDQHAFEDIDLKVQNGNLHAFARQFARSSFDRLSVDLQTAVTVALYDVDRVQGYLRAVDSVDRALTKTAGGGTVLTASSVEHCDCADNPAYALPAMSSGIDVFFRAARFGRSKEKLLHSGWQCWRNAVTTASTTQRQDATGK